MKILLSLHYKKNKRLNMAVKVTSVSLPQETIEKVNELSMSVSGSFSAKIDAVIKEAYDLSFWAGVDLGEVFTEEEVNEMRERCILLSETAKFSNELFLKICGQLVIIRV